MGPGCSPESFTDKLYLLIERLGLDDQRCGEVLGFFRGFCRAFFRRPAPITEESGSDRQSTAASAQDLEAETPGLLNFNDLLAVLLDWCCPDQTVADLDPPLTTWNPNELIPELTRLIEAMDQDERLAPELLLGGFSSDRCVLRRKRLSYAAGLDLETVDVLMTMLSSLRRLYRNAPPAFISAGHP
ncbi:MAG: hypothetical protein VKI63_09420 [Cyanobium sp.]|nr:hypothetical protein [Cyanobium sp.]